MKVLAYGGQLNDPRQIGQLERMLGHLKGTCYVSERQKKPNGVWRRKTSIDSDGVWFYKNRRGHTTFEIWKLVGKADRVVIDTEPADVSAFTELKLNGDEDYETVADGIRVTKGVPEFFLSEKYHPHAYRNMMEDLIESGLSVAEAKRRIDETPIELEVYYEKGRGLFAVDSAVIESGRDISSPYSGIKLEK